MKRSFLISALCIMCYTLCSAQTPTLSILTQSRGEVQIPISDISQITYDKVAGTEMYVATTSGTQTYAISDIVRMSLSNMSEPTDLETITPEQAENATKVLYRGAIYVVKDGKVFTLKGEAVQ